MMPAAKMMDPVLGIDIHIIQPPGPVPPVPIPHPFVGMLFDPMELAPFIGASVFVNGMPKATAGSEGKALPPHIPIGGVFVPPPPGNECEMFMGSATVLFEGEPASYLALPALSCQSIGMPAPFRPKKKPKPILKLPTSVVLPIPAGPPVLIGGPPTISMTVMAMKAGMSALGKAGAKFRKYQQGSAKWKAVSAKLKNKASKAMDALGVPSSSSIRNKVDNAICTVTGHPVDVATGKVFTDNVDFELPGPVPLRWKRIYFTTSVYQGPLGHGWHHAYDLALAETEAGAAIRFHDGRPLAFLRLKPGQSFFLRSEKATLSRDDEGYVLRTKEGLLYRFAPVRTSGRPQPLVSVSNAVGQRIAFAYDSRGHLEAIRDSCGRLLEIRTDQEGRIRQILAPHPEARDETFPIISYRYDEAGDLVEARDAHEQCWRFAYRNHLLVKETNRNGLSFHFEYDAKDPSARCLRTWGDGGIFDHKLSYDPDAKTTEVENSLGHKTLYHFTDAGLVSRVRNARGHSSLTLYNEFNELVSEVDELGREQRHEYDDSGNRIRTTGPGGVFLEVRFRADAPISAKDALGREWKWEYDDKHRLVRRVDPLGREIQYVYEGPRLIALSDSNGRETRFRYGPSGELEAALLPRGDVRWTYDRLGRCIASTDPRGNIQARTFDLLGRMRRVEEPDGNVREMQYDPEGNVLRAKDNHRQVSFRYEGMDRMTARTERGMTVEFRYDTEQRLIGLRNEGGAPYTFELDPVGEVITETGFDGAERKYVRDPLGHIMEVERPGGIRTRYAYDAAGRITGIIHSTGEREEFKYRVDGELMEAVNDTVKVAFQRDLLGRLLVENQGGHTVESVYDSLGLRTEIRSSLGARQRITRDSLGDVLAVAFGAAAPEGPKDGAPLWETRFVRDRLGLELERTLPGGLKSQWKRDKLGRPLRHNLISDRGFRSREYRWDVNDRLLSVHDSAYGPTEFEHDPLGNLIGSLGPDHTPVFRVPDALGNIFRSPDREDRKYGPAGQLLEASTPKGAIRYEYDPEGNLKRKIEPGNRVWTYHWNAAGMLARVERPDGSEVAFTYDALGRRMSKTHRGRTTRWVWDGNNPLHEWVECGDTPGQRIADPSRGAGLDHARIEALAHRSEAEFAGRPSSGPPGPPRDDSGTVEAPITWIFDPETFSPMGKMVAGRSFSIITDHQGSPTAMVDAQGKEVWSGRLDIYGQVTAYTGEKASCPFRFPGQYEDEECGLHYNRFRYYDAWVGQYISQDPIRLHGGLPLYAYSNDPNRWFDPLGLSDCLLYRSLRPEEVADVKTKGLKPKDPNATATPMEHVLNGSDPDFASQFISTSKKDRLPKIWAKKSGTAVAVIDPSKVPGRKLDLSTGQGRLENLGDVSKAPADSPLHDANRMARGADEVLVEGDIPPEAIVDVIYI